MADTFSASCVLTSIPPCSETNRRFGADQVIASMDSGLSPIVLDSRELLLDPHGVLVVLCDRLGIGFDDRMLSWTPGAPPEDGVWAEHWYARVHQSSGFRPYRPRSERIPPDLAPLLDACWPLYARLYEHPLRAA